MAISYSSTFGALILYTGMYLRMNSSRCTIGLYKGERPDVNSIQANWTKYNATGSETLAIVPVTCAYDMTNDIMYATALPVASQVKPIAEGTATWAIVQLRSSVQTSTPWNSSTLNDDQIMFLVADVSDALGTGLVRLETVDLSPSTAITSLDMSLGLSNA